MASEIITIPTPVLISPATFRIRYRKVGDLTWTTHGFEDNDPFTLTVPTVDQYEIEVKLANCDPFILGPVNIGDRCGCPVTSNDQIQYQDALTSYFTLDVSGTFPAPCGYSLRVTESGIGGRSYGRAFSSGSPSPWEVSIRSGFGVSWVLIANCCAGKETVCASGQLAAPSSTCVSVDIEDTGTAAHMAGSIAPGTLGFIVKFKQSTPVTTPITVNWAQLTFGGSTVPPCIPDSGSLTLFPVPSGNPTYPWQVTFAVKPNSCFQPFYTVYLTDICGNNVTWL